MITQGETLRDDGCERVRRNRSEWVDKAVTVIGLLASTGDAFTSDDVRAELDAPPHPNCLGAAFRVVAHDNIIERVGFQRSRTASAHAHVVGVWRGTQGSARLHALTSHSRAVADMYAEDAR